MEFVYNDGGRAAAGFRGRANDCLTRAMAIATGLPYSDVYTTVNQLAGASVARTGVPKDITKAVMRHFGFTWHPTMAVGQGCKVHLRADELPSGVLVISLTKHLCAVIDGVIHDTHDPSRGGSRCAYGW